MLLARDKEKAVLGVSVIKSVVYFHLSAPLQGERWREVKPHGESKAGEDNGLTCT